MRLMKTAAVSTPVVLLAITFAAFTPRRAGAQKAPPKKQEFDALAAALVLEQTFVKVIANAEKSVVSIARVKRRRPPERERRIIGFGKKLRNPNDAQGADFIPNEFGSGIIISPAGKERFILTNYHVVKGGPVYKGKANDKSDSKLYVRLHNRRSYEAEIIAADPRSDLAVLTINYAKLAMKREQVIPLPMGSRDAFRKGQIVLALGNPYAQARDGSASASWGMISNISRRPKPADTVDNLVNRKKETLHHLGTLLHLDTRLNIGTSGGALLNLKGELIGMTTSLAALEGYESSVGYAVPFDAAMRRVIATLVKGHEVEYGFLGIRPLDVTPDSTPPLPRRLKRAFGARAYRVHANSPAGRAGIRLHDIILDVNDRPVRDRYDLMRHVGSAAPESVAKLRIWRSSESRELILPVRLGKWPVLNEEDIIATSRRYPAWRGIRVDYSTGRHKYMSEEFHLAVLVVSVDNPALKKGRTLLPGDFITQVNGRPVKSPREFAAVTTSLRGPAVLKLAADDLVPGREIRVAP